MQKLGEKDNLKEIYDDCRQYLCSGIMSNPMSKWRFTLVSGIRTWTSHKCPVTDLHGNQVPNFAT